LYRQRTLDKLVSWIHAGMAQMRLTFIAIFVIDRKVEIFSITKAALDDNITFELKDGDTGTIKFHSGRIFLRLELEEHGGRHDVRLYCRSRSTVKSWEFLVEG
jgi:hypothetical protein